MDLPRIIVGVILPYLAITIFAIGMGRRFYAWKKLPSPRMTLFPTPVDERGNAVNTLKEVFFFKSLFKGDRLLWGVAWLFHVVLALIFAGHVRVFANVDAWMLKLGLNEEQIDAMSSGVGGMAGVVIMATAVFLLLRRLLIQRVREVTGINDCLALLLIGAIIITGNMMRFGSEHFDLSLTREYFASLATFSSVVGTPALENNMFLLHMCLALLLIMFIPFSKILHFGGIFFTHQMIRKH